ncbi:MAG: lytic transglycosylase domain-containing protein [Gordonia sp. (in: high G+C Gram-positive bacteria)]
MTTGVAAVGAAMLTGATASSSAQAGTTTTTVAQAAQAVGRHTDAQAVPAQLAQLYGFAPPTSARDTRDPQFRIADDLPNGPLGIPGVVLQAYKLAATRVAAENPQCKLPWYLLAGIGRIESGHAGDGDVDEFGNTRTEIRGPVLDGSLSGHEVITDTDKGRWDGDPKHDRAMGPMQFIPSTWKTWGSDANGDGEADPDNIFDATFSAGRYLCSGVTDIMSEKNKIGAVLRYNRSRAYVNNVLGWAAAYATGAIPTEGIPGMDDEDDKKDERKRDRQRARDRDRERERAETPAPSTSTKPKPAPPQQHCLGAVCLPPGVGPQPVPPSSKKPSPTTRKAPTTRTSPNNPR